MAKRFRAGIRLAPVIGLALGLAAVVPGAAKAAEGSAKRAGEEASWSCRNAGSGGERKVVVRYPEGPKRVPCEVVYIKNGEGETLWSANAKAGYCEEKAKSFAEKLGTLGWSCKEEPPG